MERRDEFIGYTYTLTRTKDGPTQQIGPPEVWACIKTCTDNVFIVVFASALAYLTVEA